ncbi:MAG: hypothetical protein JWQ87_205 [Candidatus Sulfotelmatobacter sp.]|nr:hypothetical protein [Candidatus Sulfotelmatobacter sp.]
MGIVKLTLGFLAIAAVVLALFQVAPPIMSNYSFQDDLKTVALMDGTSLTKTDDDIRNDVLRRAKEHDLPISDKQVTVQRINTPGIAAVYLAADYTVTINFPGYAFDMRFNPNSGNKGF